MIYILGKPLHLWLGIITFILLILTAASGMMLKKFGLKTHRTLALLTIISALAHALIAIIVWL